MIRDILNEFLRPQSSLWPEVKLFLSMCKSAGQRLPMEVQVSNIMNVRRGLKRLSRLKGDEDPSEIQALLQWITDRSEIAGAFCLQRLKIGHQVNWICALLASIARIRQFCFEVLENIQRKTAKRKRDICTDSGTPLDRNSFNKFRKTIDFEASSTSSTSRPAISLAGGRTASVTTCISETTETAMTALATTSSTPTTCLSTDAARTGKTELKDPCMDVECQGSGERDSKTGNSSEKSAEISRVKKHPRMVELRADIKLMIEAQTDATKKASLKKVYGIALKRSLNQPVTEESIKKVCKLAMKKAKTYCE